MSNSVGRAINMMTIRVSKSFFNAGIADMDFEGEIIKRFHLDEGSYLSLKGRICSWKTAATFNTKEEAVLFFHEWVNENKVKRAKYKLEVIEYTSPEDVHITLYDETHPLWIIEEKENPSISKAARAYFYDYLHEFGYSENTLKTYRREILKYGIDINSRVDSELNLSLRSARIREQYYQDNCSVHVKKTQLHIV
ncbi:hypothetical protein [Cellvibrio fibrivorans]|uniref:Core-binding (CB) domain-containing protein n=1 Tax=Cellvibrio fibrivorans TaxID=126350 RepID=A0ABU1USR6_9GAMM|nr:hypothetical protein [Cellvibrio fibrivorans]MDR7088227.1 hypothetical protein [Cellvibrio fibrivorans]